MTSCCISHYEKAYTTEVIYSSKQNCHQNKSEQFSRIQRPVPYAFPKNSLTTLLWLGWPWFFFSVHTSLWGIMVPPLEVEPTFTATESHMSESLWSKLLLFPKMFCLPTWSLEIIPIMALQRSVLELRFFSPIKLSQYPLWFVQHMYHPRIYTSLPLYSSSSVLQINFRCKPSFRESGSRNIREVSSGSFFLQIVVGGPKQCCCWSCFKITLILHLTSSGTNREMSEISARATTILTLLSLWLIFLCVCSAHCGASSLGTSETARRQMQTMWEGEW